MMKIPTKLLDVDSPMSLFLHTTDDVWNPGSEGFCQQQLYHPIEMLKESILSWSCSLSNTLRVFPYCSYSISMIFLYTNTYIYIYIQQEVYPRPIGKPPAPRVDIYIYIYVYYIIQSTISCVSLYAHLIFDQQKSWAQNHWYLFSSCHLLRSSQTFPPRCLVSGACRCLAWTAEATWLCCGPWCGRDVFTGDAAWELWILRAWLENPVGWGE